MHSFIIVFACSLWYFCVEYLPTIQNTVRKHLAKWITQGTILGQEESRLLSTDLAARCILGFDYTQREVYLLTEAMETIEKGFFSLPYEIPGSPLSKVKS